MDTNPQNHSSRKLFTVKAFAQRVGLTEPSIRSLLFNSDKNGFAKCIRRLGRRVLIDEFLFFECLDQINKVEVK